MSAMKCFGQIDPFPKPPDVFQSLILLIGGAALISCWFSIEPSIDHRHQEMLASDKVNPGSVSAEDWISHEIDVLPKALGLIVVGTASFAVVSVAVAGVVISRKQTKHLWVYLGLAWIFLGGLLHLLVWQL